MCVVSMTGDFFNQRVKENYPWVVDQINQQGISRFSRNLVSREEFNDLKKEVELMKELLVKSKEYDAKNNEPECETESKMKFLRAAAKLVGVDLEDVIKK